MRPALLVVAMVLMTPALAGPLRAQVHAFRFDSTRVPVGRVYHYLKSNRDGSHPANISVYVAAVDRLESLKWSPGDTTATLVVARMDWTRFSVGRFESWRLYRGRDPLLAVSLDADAGGTGVRVSLMPDSLFPIHGWPWHSYDFDFASLSLSLAHLRNPEQSWQFHRADPNYGSDGPPFADLGPVDVQYAGREVRAGRAVRRYALSGPGVRGLTGQVRATVDGAFLVELEMPFPDEPGYTDVRVVLQAVETMGPTEWDAYKRRRVSGER